ncbi:MAG TPA: hypothetical protein VJA26_18735 [Gammaproteobacteria bacterium]|nr:hypothetical protein [Gammaproteobacteria bacterium]
MTRPAAYGAFCLGLVVSAAAAAEDYSFDPSQFEKKPFELSGYIEARAEHFVLNRQSGGYQLNFFDQPRRTDFSRATAAAQIDGIYRRGIASFRFVGFGAYSDDYMGTDHDTRIYEAYASIAPSDHAVADLGKKTLAWGKGYAFNPVGFIQRPKDPNDPDLAREGFVIAGGNFVRSFDGTLKTLAFTPLIAPVSNAMNEDFGASGHLNPAAKLYLLYADTDIDFMMLGAGSRSARYGFDFSRNLGTNIEIHGEWARITAAARPVTDAAGNIAPIESAATSYLLGLRYLSERDLTTILEYYYNGAGYREQELSTFYDLVHRAYDQFQTTGNAALLQKLRNAMQPAYAAPNPGRRYLYLRLSQKEPFDILYVTPALTVVTNLDDRSYSVAPELLYTGVTNLELRLRLFLLHGDSLTDFGEKQNDRRLELRLRYFF